MNKTQCPHCFTVFVISDEQLRVSQGMVRCGTCKERFQAELLGEQKVQPFDPRDAFIEPISDQDGDSDASVTDLIKNSEQVDFELKDFDEEPKAEPATDLKGNVNSDAATNSYNPVAENTPFDSKDSVDSNNSVSSNDSENNNFEFSEEAFSPTAEEFNDKATTIDVESQHDTENLYANDGGLIDEVNQLIQQKIMPPVETNTATQGADNDQRAPVQKTSIEKATRESEFSLSTKPKRRVITWFYGFALLLIVVVLSAGLAYQLWLKQVISWPNNERLNATIAPIVEPLKEPVAKGLEQLEISIPERRNLSRLELVSARTAPHPRRSSTILLRVSLINGAQISQPLPWLELSLHDSDGRLISRRGLSPSDYSHNNRIKEKIGPRELRKVTIELLKFPEHATGYELRLLNK